MEQVALLPSDPIRERGGPNLYGFCGNDAVDNFDPLGAVVGNFRVLHSNTVRKFQFAGWSIRFRWSPPNDWPVDCPKCKKAVWVQNWSNDKTTIFSHTTTGPEKDWDESNYQGNSELWVNGKFPRGSRNDSAEMWDDPSITPFITSCSINSWQPRV